MNTKSKTYEIVNTHTGKIIETLTAPWANVYYRVQKLNSSGIKVYARKPQPVKERFEHKHQATHSPHVLCCDAWTSGNPGLGGCRVCDLQGNTLDEWNSDTRHTNNYYELTAIGLAIKYAKKHKYTDIYSDSRTALAWIYKKRVSRDTHERDTIQDMILKIYGMLLGSNIKILKWNTQKYGEIPADYGRK
ncbi:MAG: RNase H family protein [Elusimicrobiota bacterium]